MVKMLRLALNNLSLFLEFHYSVLSTVRSAGYTRSSLVCGKEMNNKYQLKPFVEYRLDRRTRLML